MLVGNFSLKTSSWTSLCLDITKSNVCSEEFILKIQSKNDVLMEFVLWNLTFRYKSCYICVDCACSKNGTELKLINFRSLLKHLTPTNYDSIFEHVANVIFVSTKNLKWAFWAHGVVIIQIIQMQSKWMSIQWNET